MTDNQFNPTIIEEGLGAVAIGATIIASPLLRRWYSRWGATQKEIEEVLPGDDVVAEPDIQNTRAITIEAPVETVWPWLVQMGQGRGGLYSYERLENLVGCDMHNADRIIAEHQVLAVGDRVQLSQGDDGPVFVVQAIHPGRAIVLGGENPPSTWSFVIEPLAEKRTRLLIRFRLDYEPTVGNVIMWRMLVDPIHFVMERKMLQGIKARVEASVEG